MGKKQVPKYQFPIGSQTEKIQEALKFLGLDASAASFQYLAQQTQQEHGTIFDFLEQLLEIEFAQKEDSRIALRLRSAKVIPFKQLDDFDFTYQNSIDPVLIRDLASCRFIDEGKNLIIVGPPGVGKTHIAMSIAYEAIKLGKSVRCMHVHECESVIKSTTVTAYTRLFKALVSPEVLVLDDIDYFRTDSNTGQMLHDVLRERDVKNLSTVITSNKKPPEWAKLMGKDTTQAITMLDRLMNQQRAVVVNIRGNSYRVPRPAPQSEDAALTESKEKTVWKKKPLRTVLSHLK